MDLSATQRDKGDNKENGLTVFVHTIVWFLTRHALWIKSQIIWIYPKYPSGKEPIRSVCRREVKCPRSLSSGPVKLVPISKEAAGTVDYGNSSVRRCNARLQTPITGQAKTFSKVG